MSEYQRPVGSVDAKIEEIPEGTHRVKIIGTIVAITPTNVTVNDGTGTVILDLAGVSIEGMELKTLGRFIATIKGNNNTLTGSLIAWQPFPKELLEKYWKLVEVERRIPESMEYTYR